MESEVKMGNKAKLSLAVRAPVCPVHNVQLYTLIYFVVKLEKSMYHTSCVSSLLLPVASFKDSEFIASWFILYWRSFDCYCICRTSWWKSRIPDI